MGSALIRRKRSSGSTPNLVSPSKSKTITKTKNAVDSTVNDPASVARSVRSQPVGGRSKTEISSTTNEGVGVRRVPLHKMNALSTAPILRKGPRNADDLASFKQRFGVRSSMNAPGHSISKQHAEIVQMVPFQSSSGSIEFRRTIRLVDGHSMEKQHGVRSMMHSFVPINGLIDGGSTPCNYPYPSTWTLYGNGRGVCSGGIWSDDQFQSVGTGMVTAEEAVHCVVNESQTSSESTFSADTPNEIGPNYICE